MSEDPESRGLHDTSLISLAHDHELRYWCHILSCSAYELKEAIKAVGNSALNVRQHITKDSA